MKLFCRREVSMVTLWLLPLVSKFLLTVLWNESKFSRHISVHQWCRNCSFKPRRSTTVGVMLGLAGPFLVVSLFWGTVGIICPFLVPFFVPKKYDRGCDLFRHSASTKLFFDKNWQIYFFLFHLRQADSDNVDSDGNLLLRFVSFYS